LGRLKKKVGTPTQKKNRRPTNLGKDLEGVWPGIRNPWKRSLKEGGTKWVRDGEENKKERQAWGHA